MKEVFFKNIFLLLIVNIIVKPFWIFGIDLKVQNTLGAADYGHYLAIFNLSLIYQIILDLGLQTYSTQRLSKHAKRIHWLFPNIMMAKSMLSLLYFVLLIITAYLLGYRGHSMWLVILLGFTQTANSFLLYLRSCIVSLHQYKKESILSVLDKFIVMLLGIGLLYTPYATFFTIDKFIIIQIIGYSISAIVALIFIRRTIPIHLFQVNYHKIIPIIQKGLPYALMVFIMSIYFKGDVVILERITADADARQAGIYNAVYRLLDAANNLSGVLISGMIMPMFGRSIRNTQETLSIINAGTTLLLSISIIAVGITYFFGAEIMTWLYIEYQPGQGKLLMLAFLSFPFYCLNYIYSSYLTARGDVWYIIKVVSIAALISVVGNLYFTPLYGAWATAIIASIVHGIAAILFIIRTYTFLPYSFNKMLAGKMVIAMILYSLCLLLMQYLGLIILFTLIIAAIIGLGIMMLLRLIPFNIFRKKLH